MGSKTLPRRLKTMFCVVWLGQRVIIMLFLKSISFITILQSVKLQSQLLSSLQGFKATLKMFRRPGLLFFRKNHFCIIRAMKIILKWGQILYTINQSINKNSVQEDGFWDLPDIKINCSLDLLSVITKNSDFVFVWSFVFVWYHCVGNTYLECPIHI